MPIQDVLLLLFMELLPTLTVLYVFFVRPDRLLQRNYMRWTHLLLLVLALPLLLAPAFAGGAQLWWLHVTASIVLGVAVASCRYRVRAWYAVAWRRPDNWHFHHAITVIRVFARLGWQIDVAQARPSIRTTMLKPQLKLVITKGYKRYELQRTLGAGDLGMLFWLVMRQHHDSTVAGSESVDPTQYSLVVSLDRRGKIVVNKAER